MKEIEKVSDFFKLDKSQDELDFVDTPIYYDLEVFIDAFILRLFKGSFYSNSLLELDSFFKHLLKLLKNKDRKGFYEAFAGIGETKELHFGYSKGRKGPDWTDEKINTIYKKLIESKAVEEQKLSELSDCCLLIEGIGKDTISDMVSKIIMKHLIIFTQNQCDIHNITRTKVFSIKIWESSICKWVKRDYLLPNINSNKIILAPKTIIVNVPVLETNKFYRSQMVPALKEYEISLGTSLVITLKSGPKVRTKDIKKKYPSTKKNVITFLNKNPDTLSIFKSRKNATILKDPDIIIHEAYIKLLKKTLKKVS